MQYNYLLAQTAAQRRNFYGLSTSSMKPYRVKKGQEYYESGKFEKEKFIAFVFWLSLCYECDDQVFGKRGGRYLSGEYREWSQSESGKRYNQQEATPPETIPEPTQEPLTTEPVATWNL